MSKTQQEAESLYLIPCKQGYESTKDPKNSKPILFYNFIPSIKIV